MPHERLKTERHLCLLTVSRSRTDWDDDDDDDDQRPKQGQEEPSEAFGAFTTMAAMGGGGDACNPASRLPSRLRSPVHV